MKTRGIRWHLAQVLLVSIVPIGLVGALLLFLHWRAQEEVREHSQMEATRLLAAAVDHAIDSTEQRLAIFARLLGSSELQPRQVYQQAQAALAGNPDWDNILLWTADGKGVFRLDRAFGEDLGSMQLVDQWRPAVAEARPVLSEVFNSPSRGRKVAAVAVPVRRDGRVTHLLMASLNFPWFDELLNKGLPQQGGVAGIFDRDWKFVARSSEGEQRRGSDPAGPLVEDMKRNPEGIGRYSSLNDIDVYTSWTRTRHGWWVAYATPSSPIDGAFWRHLGVFGLLWAAAVAVGVLYAVRKARLVTRALDHLERDAALLARGRAPAQPAASGISEADRAFEALELAGGLVAAALRERDVALETEREARSAAERANRAKDEFLAMLSHELRNPVGAISNSATILRSSALTEAQRAFATGVIERQSGHLGRLIDDLLDVGRAMTGKIVLSQAPLDLAASVRHVVRALEAAGKLADRQVEATLVPAWMRGDATRVEQIASNLLANAAAHTSPGGRIRIEVAVQDGDAVLRVADDGAGIAPAHLPRLFDLFFQADATVDRARGGLGIGLTLVQRLAALHGGRVRAESPGTGRGATFTVRFPALPDVVDLANAGAGSAEKIPSE